MSCEKEHLDCKDCDCNAKKTKFEECCPKKCRCMSEENYQKLRDGFNSSPKKGYCFEKQVGFVKILCKAQYELEGDEPDPKRRKSTKSCKINRRDCQLKSKCFLVPYNKAKDDECCPGQTGHHLLPDSLVKANLGNKLAAPINKGAPTVCVAGGGHSKGTHGLMHFSTKKEFLSEEGDMTFNQACDASIKAHKKVFKNSNCDDGCMKKQLTDYYPKNVKNGKFDRNKYGSAPNEDKGSSYEHIKEINEEIGDILGTDATLF